MLTNKSKILLSLLLGLAAFFSLLAQFVAYRPIQDDYFILGALVQQPVSSIIQSVWESQGGNLLPYAANSLLLASSLNSLDFVASRVFIIATAALVVMVSLSFLKWVGLKSFYLKASFVAISLLAFEGVFTPLQIAAYSWHQTSISHLWPVALTMLAWCYAGCFKYSALVLAITGVSVGNSNSAEALWSIMATALFLKTFLFQIDGTSTQKRAELKVFILAGTLGFALTVVAPGFWNRANNSVGMPDSISDLVYRFGKSIGAFSFDLLTHPFLWMVLIFGMLCRRHFDQMELLKIPQIAAFLGQSSIILYSLLVLGTTIGYPAWHQALGLYVIFVPTLFLTGVILSEKLGGYRIRVFKTFLCFFLILSVGFSIRSTVLVVNRAHHWDLAYKSNVCSISQGKLENLIGAELIYPVFQKGIEDINSWPWMRAPYIDWVSSHDFNAIEACRTH